MDLEDAMQTRIAEIISEYSGQGVHRTGTEVDDKSADWLARKIESLGVVPIDSPFTFRRLETKSSVLSFADTSISGVPLYDCGYTDKDGIIGRIGELGSAADIGLIMALPFEQSPNVRRVHAARQAGQHKAIVMVTDKQLPEEGIALVNAEDFGAPFGPPVLQVASKYWSLLQRAIDTNMNGRLVLHSEYVGGTARNIEAKIAGSNPVLNPIVVMTPRSGWWANASERGGGLAAFLEIMRAVKTSMPKRDVIFTANTGHELGHSGLELFLDNNSSLLKNAHMWIHLGANFAAKFGSQVRLQYSDEQAVASLAPWLVDNDLVPAVETPMGQRPLGEARNIYDGGGRFISILGGNALFHHPADLWPTAVDLELTTKYVKAFTQLVVVLAAD